MNPVSLVSQRVFCKEEGLTIRRGSEGDKERRATGTLP